MPTSTSSPDGVNPGPRPTARQPRVRRPRGILICYTVRTPSQQITRPAFDNPSADDTHRRHRHRPQQLPERPRRSTPRSHTSNLDRPTGFRAPSEIARSSGDVLGNPHHVASGNSEQTGRSTCHPLRHAVCSPACTSVNAPKVRQTDARVCCDPPGGRQSPCACTRPSSKNQEDP